MKSFFSEDTPEIIPSFSGGLGNEQGFNWYAECQRGHCVVRSGEEFTFGRLGLSPLRITREIAASSTQGFNRNPNGLGENRRRVLSEAATATLGSAPAVSLLFDDELANRFRKRCQEDEDTAIADLLHYLRQPTQRNDRACAKVFSKRVDNSKTMPAGCEHAIEWALVRLWCESVRRPDNVLDLLSEEGAAARFIAMTRKSTSIALSGVSDDHSRAEQSLRWALLLEERRDNAPRVESESRRYVGRGRSSTDGIQPGIRRLDELEKTWLELGRDRVGQRRESGLVRLNYGNEVAWIGLVSNVPISLMTVTSDGTLDAAAASGWWDLRPSLLRTEFMGAKECMEALSSMPPEDRDMGTKTWKPFSREWAIAAETFLIERHRPFLNLPFWPRTGARDRG